MSLADLQGGLDHGAVTKMDAVKIAHRHHGPPRDRALRRIVANNSKTNSHFLLRSSGILKVDWRAGTVLAGTIGVKRAKSHQNGRNPPQAG
ncbi:hypothetical protein [Bradyrhizobium cenepequi]|uniref:hypothetical protein n=1 Tax=Bradyrhizobium cenepequi TaxID=2821403 RepID=UPI001CE3791A|nr:hypothetical protein [Bradyrhizobium cenepequi]